MTDPATIEKIARKDLVLRGGNTLMIGDDRYDLTALINASYAKAKAAKPCNPAYYMPPIFFSGSPYASVIRSLGYPIGKGFPTKFRAEYVPQSAPAAMQDDLTWRHIYDAPCPPQSGR